jgi:hypothetical protein
MEFGLPIELVQRHELMRMKRILIMSLLCFVISSCTNQQAAVATSPIVPPYVSKADGIFATHPDRWRFYEWRLSFTLPSQWMAKDLPPDYFGPYKVDHFANTDGNGDNWIFYSEPIENEKGEQSFAEIRFRFQNIPDGFTPNDISETEWETCSASGFRVDDISNPEKIGNDIYQPTLFKCSFAIDGSPNQESYVIHAIHQTRKDVGIEIVLIANSDIFSKIENDFQLFMQRLSFEL